MCECHPRKISPGLFFSGAPGGFEFDWASHSGETQLLLVLLGFINIFGNFNFTIFNDFTFNNNFIFNTVFMSRIFQKGCLLWGIRSPLQRLRDIELDTRLRKEAEEEARAAEALRLEHARLTLERQRADLLAEMQAEDRGQAAVPPPWVGAA